MSAISRVLPMNKFEKKGQLLQLVNFLRTFCLDNEALYLLRHFENNHIAFRNFFLDANQPQLIDFLLTNELGIIMVNKYQIHFNKSEFKAAANQVQNYEEEAQLSFLYFNACFMDICKRFKADSKDCGIDRQFKIVLMDLKKLIKTMIETYNCWKKCFLNNYLIARLYSFMSSIDKKIGERSIQYLISSIRLCPAFISSWNLLLDLMTSYHVASKCELNQNNIFYHQFIANVAIKFHLQDELAEQINMIEDDGFYDNPILYHLKGRSYYSVNCEDIDYAEEYSEILFTLKDIPTLALLASKFIKSHYYHYKTAIITAHYFSLRCNSISAIKWLERSLDINPLNSKVCIFLAQEYLKMSNQSLAIKYFRDAIEIDPKSYGGLYGLALTYDIMKLEKMAIYYYELAVNCCSNNQVAIENLATLYFENNRIESAIKCYERSGHVNIKGYKSLYRLAIIYKQIDKPDKAADAFTKLLLAISNFENVSAIPEYKEAHFFLANYYKKRNDMTKFQTHSSKFVECSSDQVDINEIFKD
ncbi:MAG: Anaphase-promoting complex subunit 23 [Marteilia pararefringens]